MNKLGNIMLCLTLLGTQKVNAQDINNTKDHYTSKCINIMGYNNAKKCYIENTPDEIKDHNRRLFELAFHEGNYKEAITRGEVLIYNGQEKASIFSMIGYSYLKINKYQKAIDNFTQAIEKEPNGLPMAYFRISKTYRGLKNTEKEIEYLEKFIEVATNWIKEDNNKEKNGLSKEYEKIRKMIQENLEKAEKRLNELKNKNHDGCDSY